MNSVHLSGYLATAPVCRYTSTGKAVANFRIAVDNPFKKDDTNFFSITAWGRVAEAVSSNLTKGDFAIVIGQLANRSYTPEGAAKPLIYTYVNANRIEYHNPKKFSKTETSDNQPMAKIESDITPSVDEVAELFGGSGENADADIPF